MTARALKPKKESAPPGQDDDAILDQILPPIDESDPEWQAYVREKVREALDDPRPDVPAEEAFARVDRFIAEYKARRGL